MEPRTSTESTLAAVRPWSFGYIWPHIPRFDDLTSPSTHGMHETYEGGWNVGPFPTRGKMKGCRIGSSTLCFPLQVTSFAPAMGVLVWWESKPPRLAVPGTTTRVWRCQCVPCALSSVGGPRKAMVPADAEHGGQADLTRWPPRGLDTVWSMQGWAVGQWAGRERAAVGGPREPKR